MKQEKGLFLLLVAAFPIYFLEHKVKTQPAERMNFCPGKKVSG